jgi:hypothetical protein
MGRCCRHDIKSLKVFAKSERALHRCSLYSTVMALGSRQGTVNTAMAAARGRARLFTFVFSTLKPRASSRVTSWTRLRTSDMEVPFISSGALNRTHYALVRKVESATSTQAADQALLTEIKSIRHHFQSNPTVSTVRAIQSYHPSPGS